MGEIYCELFCRIKKVIMSTNTIWNKNIKHDRNKIRKKNNVVSKKIILFIMFLSNILFRTQENMNVYAMFFCLICLYGYYQICIDVNIISRIVTNRFFVWLSLLFSMYFSYGLFIEKYDYFSFQYFIIMLSIILVTMLCFIDVPMEKMTEIFISVSAITALLVTLFIMFSEWESILNGSTRIGSSGSGNVNTLAVYLGMLSIPCMYKMIFENKYSYALPYIVSTCLMLLTGSKKGLLIIIITPVLFAVTKYRGKLYKYLRVIVLITFFLLITLKNPHLYNIIGYRVVDFLGTLGVNLGGASSSYSTAIRIYMNEVAIRAISKSPVFGSGWGFFSVYSGLGTYSHNNYLELLVTYGFFGFILYYFMSFFVLYKLVRILNEDDYAKLFFVLLITILVIDFAVVSFSYNVVDYQILLISYLYVQKFYKNRILY